MQFQPQQFQDLADKANAGGYSVIPSQNLAPVKDAYVVGGITPTKQVSAPASGMDISDHFDENEEHTDKPNGIFGAWKDNERIDLDVSDAYDRTREGGREARKSTVTRDERAYGEVDDEGNYVGTHVNPFSTQVSLEGAGTPEYFDRRATRRRRDHFLTGITSEALSDMLMGGSDARERGQRAWIRSGPPSDPSR